MKFDLNFYNGKRVFVTGHTGFKGSWLCNILKKAGAEVTGFSLDYPTNPNLCELAKIEDGMHSVIGDIRCFSALKTAIDESEPEIVFHLAAQPIVRTGYQNPLYTYETNVMGTVNILECIRLNKGIKSFLNVTTDKVYLNHEWEWGYREDEILDGYDPYSNSKSCSELITHSYKNSFFSDDRVSLSTARAGNVIGGGDFAKDRIIPDCVKAVIQNTPLIIRNPYSIRPYQHVLESLFAYLMIGAKQYEEKKYAGWYNVGPNEYDCCKTGDLVQLFADCWGPGFSFNITEASGPHEATFLKLDCSRIKRKFGWQPVWNLEKAINKTVEWTKIFLNHGNINRCMEKQIDEFLIDFNRVLL